MPVGSLEFQLVLAFPHIRLAANLRKFKKISAAEAKGQERIPAAASAAGKQQEEASSPPVGEG